MPKIKAASVAFDSTADVTSSGTDPSDSEASSPVVIYFGSQSGMIKYPFATRDFRYC